VIVAFPAIEPELAEIVAVPCALEDARPPVLTVATFGAEELQITALVTSLLLPSLNDPLAANCWLRPNARLAVPGVIVMLDNVAEGVGGGGGGGVVVEPPPPPPQADRVARTSNRINVKTWKEYPEHLEPIAHPLVVDLWLFGKNTSSIVQQEESKNRFRIS
jgi:hypothetical protein